MIPLQEHQGSLCVLKLQLPSPLLQAQLSLPDLLALHQAPAGGHRVQHGVHTGGLSPTRELRRYRHVSNRHNTHTHTHTTAGFVSAGLTGMSGGGCSVSVRRIGSYLQDAVTGSSGDLLRSSSLSRGLCCCCCCCVLTGGSISPHMLLRLTCFR